MVVLVWAGCSYMRLAIEQTRTVTVTEVERDTVVYIGQDLAWLTAWLRCDSLNMVVMQQLEASDGRLIKLRGELSQLSETRGPEPRPPQQLTVFAEIDSQAVYLAWKQKHVHEQEATIETVAGAKKQAPLVGFGNGLDVWIGFYNVDDHLDKQYAWHQKNLKAY